jgi:hypothetical protein
LINEAIDSLTDSDAFPSETGGKRAGLQHILKDHGKEFKEYHPQQLTELAEASTSIGLPMGVQGRNRPIYGLFFYSEPLAAAVQVADNGFVVSMNRKNFDSVAEQNAQHGSMEEVKKLLEESHGWPKV